jgi:hypothetical protein
VGHSARTPAISVARPVHFVAGEGVPATLVAAGCEARGDGLAS